MGEDDILLHTTVLHTTLMRTAVLHTFVIHTTVMHTIVMHSTVLHTLVPIFKSDSIFAGKVISGPAKFGTKISKDAKDLQKKDRNFWTHFLTPQSTGGGHSPLPLAS